MRDGHLLSVLRGLPSEITVRVDSHELEGNDLHLAVRPDALVLLARHLRAEHKAELVTLHATDDRALEGCFKLHLVMGLKGTDAFVSATAPLGLAEWRYESLTSAINDAV